MAAASVAAPSSHGSSSGRKRLVIIARHSERQDDGSAEDGDDSWVSDWSATNVDIPITTRGIVLAERAAAAIADTTTKVGGPSHKVQAIWCSPYLRCIQTAQVMAGGLGVESITIDARLREFHFGGDADQPSVGDVRSTFAGGPCRWRDAVASGVVDWSRFDEQTADGPHGSGTFLTTNSIAQFSSRMRSVVSHAAVAAGSGPVLLVSHGYALEMGPDLVGSDELVVEAPYTCFTALEASAKDGGVDGGAPAGDGTSSFRWTMHTNAVFRHIEDVPATARGDPSKYKMPSTMHYWTAEQGPRAAEEAGASK